MANKTDPAHHGAPVHKDCPACGGTGTFTGMFHSGPCTNCNASGWVGLDGVALDPVVVIEVQRNMIACLEAQLSRLINTPGVRKAVDADTERRRMNSIYPEGRPPLD